MNALAPLSAPVPWSNCLRYTGLCEIHGALIFLSSLSLLITLLCGLGLGGLLTIYISLLELNIILSRGGGEWKNFVATMNGRNRDSNRVRNEDRRQIYWQARVISIDTRKTLRTMVEKTVKIADSLCDGVVAQFPQNLSCWWRQVGSTMLPT